jgi:hypothetical protein
MKKILFLSMLVSFSFAGICQSFRHTASNPTGAILNASADTMSFSTANAYSIVGIQPVITKATGTMAGTSVLQGSLDGANYVAIDTLTNSNITVNSTVWTLSNPVYTYYRIITSGATTVTGTTAAKFIGRNPR